MHPPILSLAFFVVTVAPSWFTAHNRWQQDLQNLSLRIQQGTVCYGHISQPRVQSFRAAQVITLHHCQSWQPQQRLLLKTLHSPRHLILGDVVSLELNSQNSIDPLFLAQTQTYRQRANRIATVTTAQPRVFHSVHTATAAHPSLFEYLSLWFRPFYRFRQSSQDTFINRYPPKKRPTYAIALALLFGESRYLSREQWQLWQSQGVVHLIAISGLHLNIVQQAILSLLQPLLSFSRLWFPRQKAQWFSLPWLCLYACFSGYGYSQQRAWLMNLSQGFALLHWHSIPLLTNWLLTLCWVLLWDPLALYHKGFQLSYGMVCALALLAKARPHMTAPTQHLAITAISLGLSVIITHSLPWLSVISNIFAGLLIAYAALPLGMLGFILMPASPALSHGFFSLSFFAIDCTLFLMQTLQKMISWLGA